MGELFRSRRTILYDNHKCAFTFCSHFRIFCLLSSVTSYHVMSFRLLSCYAIMLRDITSSQNTSHHVTSRYVMSCNVNHIMCHIVSYVMSSQARLVTSLYGISCNVMSYVMSSQVGSCVIFCHKI